MRSLDGRVRNQGMGKADDELPWNKELVIVEPWSCNSNKGRGPLQLAFAKRVSTGTGKYRLGVRMMNKFDGGNRKSSFRLRSVANTYIHIPL